MSFLLECLLNSILMINGDLRSELVCLLAIWPCWLMTPQRRPLTLFLFLLVVEDLNGLMKRAIELNFFSGFKVRSSNLETTHIQHVDDTLILGDPLMGNLWAVKAVLRAFGLGLGLAVNFHKTSLIEINVHISFLALVENFLHIKIVSLPFK